MEVAAELHDLITEDLVKLYPEEVRYRCGTPLQRAGSLATLMPGCKPCAGGGCPRQPWSLAGPPTSQPSVDSSLTQTRRCRYCIAAVPQVRDATITVIELMDHVLSMYDRAIGQYTAGAGRAAGPAQPWRSVCCQEMRLAARAGVSTVLTILPGATAAPSSAQPPPAHAPPAPMHLSAQTCGNRPLFPPIPPPMHLPARTCGIPKRPPCPPIPAAQTASSAPASSWCSTPA